ncbi:SecDF P1 head subdomain-containing protein [Ruminococcus flavefaciens]|uniref:SecDF P1 head subdomain-containing protein n=1 Tax=Ruminococcus flavefaciens TaxID=1265 RepID=UPI00048B20F8|nr:hypothetical protein [Ruminococcus flavefaciens]
MKDNNKEIDFGIIENAELSELESLSKKIAPVSSDEKKKILEMSRRKFNINNNDIADHNEDTVSGSEPYRPRTMRKVFTAVAACIAIVGGIAGGAALLHRNGSINGSDIEETTVSEESTSLPIDSIKQHEVFFRKGDSPESPVILTGSNIKKAEMCLLDENDGSEYAIQVAFDEEGQQLFAEATSEIAGTETPISIWVDGECISTRIVDGIMSTGFMIHGNFDAETAIALTDKLSNCNTAYGLTSDDLKYGNNHVDLLNQCLQEFIDNADDNITDAFYCEYDINGDDIPELFIQYFTSNAPESSSVCELYALKGNKYEAITTKSENIWVHHNNKNGIVIIKANSSPTIYLVFKLNENNELELQTQLQCTVVGDKEVYTINREECTEEEWNAKLSEVKPEDVEWLDELTKDFYHKY